jgi:hypothetical protein
MAVGDAREKIAPGQRAGVGVGDVDLELRDHHEQRRGRHRPAVLREHVLVGGQVHLIRVHRALGRHHVADGEVGQQRTAQHLEHAQHHPAGAARQHAGPPAAAIGGRADRHEAQVVGLLAHLGDQRDTDRERSTEEVQIEPDFARLDSVVVRDARKRTRIAHDHIGKGHHQHQQPDGLRPDLQPADRRNSVRDQWNDHQRADQVAPGRRDAQRQLQRIGHHRGLEREEDEGEGGVDQRGQRGTDVAEAGAAGEQVHVDAVARGIDADGQAGKEDDQPGGQDRPGGVDEAVLHQQRGADRLENQEGRGAAEGRAGHAPFRHAAKALRGEAQRVVLERLARHPAVVVAPDLDDALRRFVAGERRNGGRVHIAQVQVPCHRHDCCNAPGLPIMAAQRSPPTPWN